MKYEQSIVSGKKANLKRYYKYLASKNRYTKNELILKTGNITEIDPHSCGNILRKTFGEPFIDPSLTTVISYQLQKKQTEVCDFTFSIPTIERYLKRLKTPKSPGPDLSSNVLLKRFATQFALPLFLLFSKMYETGVISHFGIYQNVSRKLLLYPSSRREVSKTRTITDRSALRRA